MYDIFITTNGPGEIVTWVEPFATALKDKLKDIRISVFVLPCRFATGQEKEITQRIKAVDHVYGASEFFSLLWKLPFNPSKKGVVCFLGGDLFYALLLKWRYRYRAMAYTEGIQSFKRFYDRFFLRDIDGDLMFSFFDYHQDDQKMIKTLSSTKNIVFFPGSRPDQFQYLFPLMQKAALQLPEKYHPIFNISPFIPDDLLERLMLPNCPGDLYKDKSIELMRTATLAISIPGTNNIQLAYLEVPTLIIFPLNHPEVVHFKGIGGALLNLPVLKTWGKRFVLKVLNKKVKFAALINSKIQKEIFPEVRGDLTPEQVCAAIVNLLEDENRILKMKKNLKEIHRETRVLESMTAAVGELISGS